MSNPKSQISPVPPDQYGERFVRFINGITKTREAAELEKAEERGMASPELIDDPSLSGINMNAHPRSSESQTTPRNQEATDRVMEKAEKQARRSERHGADESNVPNKKLTSARSPSPPGDPGGYTLPVVEEDVEGQSTGGRSGRSNEPSPQPDTRRRTPSPQHEPPLSSELRLPSPAAPDRPPPTPPKERLSMPNAVTSRSSTQRPHTPQSQSPSVTQVDGTIDEKDDMPPTPPKDSVKDSMMSRGRSPTPNRDKALPKPPMDDDEESLANLVLRPLDAS